jgi:small subunit ribosomal protein S1
MTKHSNMAAQEKIEPRSSGHEYAIGFVLEGTVPCVKSFRVFIDIGKDIGVLHINEVSHARMKNMDVMFIVGEKVKVSLN